MVNMYFNLHYSYTAHYYKKRKICEVQRRREQISVFVVGIIVLEDATGNQLYLKMKFREVLGKNMHVDKACFLYMYKNQLEIMTKGHLCGTVG